jgi:asparagine synthase (glutamine-hydrolysing)
MCGIIGIASTIPVTDRDWLVRGRDAMRHRGPDGCGEFWSPDGRVGLGHRRLAVIDLSAAGQQPMTDPSGTLKIVYNGEIYNFTDLRAQLANIGHVFRTHTDTEVILAAYREWGVACLERLNGMFAFALYDAAQDWLFMARDRAGEKPLFYALGLGAVRFASELKGLMADPMVPREVDLDALDCYLTMGFVPGDRCILRAAHKLPPAHALTFDLGSGHCKV